MERSEVDAWYANAKSFKHFGQKVSYFDNEADAEALVLVHGFPNSSWDWHKLWPILGQHYRLICLDFVGYGRSDKPTDYDYSVTDQADQVFRLLSHVGVRRVHLMGQATGIAVCQELLSLVEIEHDPDLPEILSMCFINGSIIPSKAPTITEQRLVKSVGDDMAAQMDEDMRQNVTTFVGNILNTLAGTAIPLEAGESDIHFAQLSGDGGLNVLRQLQHYIDERAEFTHRWEQAMCNTQMPLLAIIGENDPVWGRAMEQDLRMEMPYLDITFIPDAGHYVFLQAPEQLADAWMDFQANNVKQVHSLEFR